MTIHRKTLIIRSEDVLSAPIDDEMVLMGPDSNGYVGLDRIGRHIWELLEEPCTVERICGELVRKFNVGEEECERDVIDFLNELLRHGIVVSK